MAGGESVPGAPVPNAAQVQRENEAKIAGQAAAQMLFMAGQALGGSEWAPREGEPDLIAGAFSEYFKAKNIRDIPPGAALAFALCIYVGPRFAMPETKRRVSSLWGRVKLWIANRKLKKHGMRAVHEKDADDNGGK